MMRPLQLWLPTMTPSLSTPEMQRAIQWAFKQWSGEYRVWLLPDLDQPVSWSAMEGPAAAWARCLAIPAPHLELVHVFHISAYGQTWPPIEDVLGVRVDGLLQEWLNVKCVEFLPFGHGTIQVPRIQDGSVTYEEREIVRQDCPLIVPVPSTWDETTGAYRLPWLSYGPSTVSLETEAHVPLDAFKRIDLAGFPFFGNANSHEEGEVSVSLDGRMLGKIPKGFTPPLLPCWPDPLGRLFPCGGSVDAWQHFRLMQEVAYVSGKDLACALRKARESTMLYVTQGITMPVFVAAAEAGDVPSQLHQTGIHRIAGLAWWENAVEITRAWGPIGLFWALLLDQLESRRPYRPCKWCGRFLQGKKTQCYPEDDPLCYAKWRSTAKAQQRARQNAE